MQNIVLTLLLSLLLNSDVINGVAIKVNGIPITLYDIETAQKELGGSKSETVNLLIQNTLEEYEIDRLGLQASERDIDLFISNLMAQNRVPSKEMFFQALSYRGISKDEFLEGVKKQVLRPKLYQAISSSKVSQPTDEELKEIYNQNLSKWRVADSYDVTIYSSRDVSALREKILNPLLFNRSVQMSRESIKGGEVNGQIRDILSKTEDGQFSEVIPMGGAYSIFYINGREGERVLEFDEVVNDIRTEELLSQQKRVVENYLKRVRAEAIIEYLR